METVYVTFSVQVTEREYSHHGGKSGQAEVRFSLPREALSALDPGNVFNSALAAALARYDADEEEKEK